MFRDALVMCSCARWPPAFFIRPRPTTRLRYTLEMSGLGRGDQKRAGYANSTPTPASSAGLRLREDHSLVASSSYAAPAEPVSRGSLGLSLSAKYSAVWSAVEELSAARTRSTSLFLPLKAALVGILEIAELFKVRSSPCTYYFCANI